MFLSIELTVLFRCKRTGDIRPLYALPILFAVWVNLDRQFSYGLLVLVLFCAGSMVGPLLPRLEDAVANPYPRGLPLVRLGAVFAASCLSTLASPYGYRLH